MSQPPLRRAALYCSFFLTGVVTVLLGPLLPELSSAWRVAPADLSALFVAQFAASSVGSVLSNFRPRVSLAAGYSCMALALSILLSSGWPLGLIAMATLGFGIGLVIPATNLLVAEAFPDQRSAMLTTLNLFWGLGAVSCPTLLAILPQSLASAWLLYGLAALALIFAVVSMTLSSGLVSEPRTDGASIRNLPVRERSSSSMLPFALLLFLYVGIETTVGGWLVSLGDQVAGERRVVSLLIGTGFWLAFLIGRAITPMALRRIGEFGLYRTAITIASVGAVTLALAQTRESLVFAALSCGFGLAPLFPLTVSLLLGSRSDLENRRTGWVFAFGGLGGAVLPWFAGSALQQNAPFVVPLAGLLLMALLFRYHRGSSVPASGR